MARQKPLKDQYKPSLIQFMSFRDGVLYDKHHVFTNAELGAIIPTEIVRWMCLKVYGTPDPDIDDNPTEGRSSSIEYHKKALSFFMPNKHMHWNALANPPVGNPTKSIPVNELIKRVKKKEVRKEGKPSQARKPFLEPEFEEAIRKMKNHGDPEVRLFVSTIFVFQFNMIARIDDASEMKHEDIKRSHDHSEYSILARLCWSKNIQEERDAPDQYLVGAQNTHYCILLALSTWLEYWIGRGHHQNTSLLFGIHGQNDAEKVNKKATDLMKRILNDDDFLIFNDEKRGTHSIRKLATTRARRNGCSTDDTDTRARWKKKGKGQQDKYADVCLPFPDAKVAAALCKGGPIHYNVKRTSGISEDWILSHVVPMIAAQYDRYVALVLGRALLWRVFDEVESRVVPTAIVERVKNAYADLGQRNTLQGGENPVEKVPIIVTGFDAQVHIDLLIDDDNNNAVVGGAPRRIEAEQMRHMNSQLMALRRDFTELRAEFGRLTERQEQRSNVMSRNIIHLMRSPVLTLRCRTPHQRNNAPPADNIGQQQQPQPQQQQQPQPAHMQNFQELENAIAINEEATQALPATLSRNPRTLHTLWLEYEFGLGNRKAAKDFTREERGRVKHTFHRRKVLWDKISEMVRSGWSADEACNKIYDVYGPHENVTRIINRMKRDKRTGGHPSLRVRAL